MDVYFRQRWVDHRLAFEGQETPVILSARSIEKVAILLIYLLQLMHAKTGVNV